MLSDAGCVRPFPLWWGLYSYSIVLKYQRQRTWGSIPSGLLTLYLTSCVRIHSIFTETKGGFVFTETKEGLSNLGCLHKRAYIHTHTHLHMHRHKHHWEETENEEEDEKREEEKCLLLTTTIFKISETLDKVIFRLNFKVLFSCQFSSSFLRQYLVIWQKPIVSILNSSSVQSAWNRAVLLNDLNTILISPLKQPWSTNQTQRNIIHSWDILCPWWLFLSTQHKHLYIFHLKTGMIMLGWGC